jgi:tight adherence protein C
MAFLLVLIGLLLFGAGATLLVRAAAAGRVRVSSQMQSIGAYGAAAREALVPAPSIPRVGPLGPLAERVGRAFTAGTIDVRLLRSAGMYNIPPERFQGYRVLGAIGLPGVLLVMMLAGSAQVTSVLLVIAAAAMCWLLAPAMVKSRAQRRLNQIDRSLPQLVDVLTATVEAGLGFAGSLRLVSGRFGGPLGQELRLTMHEQNMGLSTEQALTNLLGRCETPSVRAFVRAVTQGESLGVSIGAMLRNLAGETRKRRRQSAREQMMKVPVKMLFPLVMLMLPALFIILLYPALSYLLHALGSH